MGIVEDLNALRNRLAGYRNNISAALVAQGQPGGDFPVFAAQIAAIRIGIPAGIGAMKIGTTFKVAA